MLFESKQVGIIYHFTNLKSLPNILTKGLKGNKYTAQEFKIDYKTFGSYDINETLYSYSFTRNKNLKLSLQDHKDINEYKIRIKLDGNKMSNKYYFTPISEYNYTRYNNTSEAEERILSKFQFISITNYILNINIPFDVLSKPSNEYIYLFNQCRKLSKLITTRPVEDYTK